MSDLSGSWLAQRYGLDPLRIDRMRRGGELYAVRDGGEWRYPSWQFDADGSVRPAVRRFLQAAREGRVARGSLAALLERRVGLVGGESVRELLLNGGEERALLEARTVA